MSDYWAINSIHSWDAIKKAIIARTDDGGSIGFLPVFDDKAKALDFTDGDESRLIPLLKGGPA